MNFWKANCMTSLLCCLIHSQAFRLMELYWFVCRYSKSAATSFIHFLPLCLPPSSPLSVCSLLLSMLHHFPSYPRFLLSPQRLDVLTSIYSMSPPEVGLWDGVGCATDMLTCVHMPDGLTVQVPVRRDQTAVDLLSAACKVGFVAAFRDSTACHQNERAVFLTGVQPKRPNKSSNVIQI